MLLNFKTHPREIPGLQHYIYSDLLLINTNLEICEESDTLIICTNPIMNLVVSKKDSQVEFRINGASKFYSQDTTFIIPISNDGLVVASICDKSRWHIQNNL